MKLRKLGQLPHASRFSKGGYHRPRFRVAIGVEIKKHEVKDAENENIVMQTGQYAPNSPPKSARFLCNNGTNESFATYAIRHTQCPPAPQCLTCDKHVGAPVQAASPIELASGDTYIAETDIRVRV